MTIIRIYSCFVKKHITHLVQIDLFISFLLCVDNPLLVLYLTSVYFTSCFTFLVPYTHHAKIHTLHVWYRSFIHYPNLNTLPSSLTIMKLIFGYLSVFLYPGLVPGLAMANENEQHLGYTPADISNKNLGSSKENMYSSPSTFPKVKGTDIFKKTFSSSLCS